MNDLQTLISNYLEYCRNQKRLDEKTIKAYQIDLRQFAEYMPAVEVQKISSDMLEDHIASLHQKYQPETVKRKIASLKAFFHFLEYKDHIIQNPFHRMQMHFREPAKLPKTIPLYIVENLLHTIYTQHTDSKTAFQKRNALRDAAVIELLFASGIRISELCSLKTEDINLHDGLILIHGKGNKERYIQLVSEPVLHTLKAYQVEFSNEIRQCDHFFANQNGNPLSDQAVRRMILKYSDLASIDIHITPHMFRHTFATSLLEADVDIRYIQKLLGHSSINITEIYTHVAMTKQKEILISKHPRKDFKI